MAITKIIDIREDLERLGIVASAEEKLVMIGQGWRNYEYIITFKTIEDMNLYKVTGSSNRRCKLRLKVLDGDNLNTSR